MIYKYFLSVVCFLTFFPIVSFMKQKILIVIKSDLSVFSFVECAFNVISKNSLRDPRSHRFSSKSFMF